MEDRLKKFFNLKTFIMLEFGGRNVVGSTLN